MSVIVPQIPPQPDAPLRNMTKPVFNAKMAAWMANFAAFVQALRNTAAGMTNAAAQTEGDRQQVSQDRDYVATAKSDVQALALSALNAPGTLATSITSMDLTPGPKTQFIQPNKAVIEGHDIVAAVQGDGSKRAIGFVNSYNPVTGQLDWTVERVFGAGNFSAWRIALTSSGDIPTCSLQQFWAGDVDDAAVTPAILAADKELRELPWASVLDWDVLEHGFRVFCVLQGNCTLPPPSGLEVGDLITFIPIQPATGGPYIVSYAAQFDMGGITPQFSTIAGRMDRMRGEVLRVSPSILIDANHKKAGAT